MKVLIVPDKFKYTFTANEIALKIKNSIKKYSSLSTEIMPLSDGGEGFLDVIHNAIGGQIFDTNTVNPLFEPIKAPILKKNNEIFIECSQTCGLQLIEKKKRNPLFTTTYGLGLLIKKSFDFNPLNIYIGLGGSATNDLGIGMANALGYKFTDKNNNLLAPIGKNLINIYNVYKPEKIFPEINFIALSDVNNPLLGQDGCAYTYAKQKGAKINSIHLLEKGAEHLLKILEKHFENEYYPSPGEGAAGGLGFAIKYFLNGKILSGSDFVFKKTGLEEKIKNANIIITGEGKLDAQSFKGKTVGKIYQLAIKYNKPVFVICGIATEWFSKYNLKIYPLFRKNISPEYAKKLIDVRLDYVIKKIIARIYSIDF